MSAFVLVALFRFVDAGAVIDRLSQMSPWWVGVALAVSVVQMVASAWRWRFTAGRLDVQLPLAEAVREYYVGSFLNQVLPGGVLGDVSRAWRHSRSASYSPLRMVPAATAVFLERASGQLVMLATAAGSVLYLWGPGGRAWAILLTVGIGAVALAAVRWGASRLPSQPSRSGSGRFWADARRALFSRPAFLVQLTSSLAVVATYLVVYVVAARSIGVDTPARDLLPLVAPVLVAMLIPASVAGWGLREGAAALLWGMAGLSVVDGVAISVAYGLLVLLSTTPGALLLLAPRRSTRGVSGPGGLSP